MLLEPFEDAKFLGMGFCAGNFVGEFFASALEAELDVIKAGGDEGRKFCFIERQTGGNQINVESGGASCAYKFDNVGTSQRFATCEIGLEGAELGGFQEDAGPYFGGELVGTGLQFERIRTVDAMERAAVGEFRDERQRIGDPGHTQKCFADLIGDRRNISRCRQGLPALQLEVESAFL